MTILCAKVVLTEFCLCAVLILHLLKSENKWILLRFSKWLLISLVLILLARFYSNFNFSWVMISISEFLLACPSVSKYLEVHLDELVLIVLETFLNLISSEVEWHFQYDSLDDIYPLCWNKTGNVFMFSEAHCICNIFVLLLKSWIHYGFLSHFIVILHNLLLYFFLYGAHQIFIGVW